MSLFLTPRSLGLGRVYVYDVRNQRQRNYTRRSYDASSLFFFFDPGRSDLRGMIDGSAERGSPGGRTDFHYLTRTMQRVEGPQFWGTPKLLGCRRKTPKTPINLIVPVTTTPGSPLRRLRISGSIGESNHPTIRSCQWFSPRPGFGQFSSHSVAFRCD